MRFADVLDLVRDSLPDPRGVFRRLKSLSLDPAEIWQALIAVIALSVTVSTAEVMLAGHLASTPASAEFGPEAGALAFSPFALALVGFFSTVVTAICLFVGGRLLGGTGSFPDALLAMTWLQVMVICASLLQLVLILLPAGLGDIYALAVIGMVLWLLTGFTAEMHGFRSLPRVFAGLLIGLFGLSFILALVLAMVGLPFPVGSGGMPRV